LGEFARRYPAAVKKLAARGHEIACHGMTHDLIYEMPQTAFREYLKTALGTLGELTGKTPIGFRAPSWSVDRRTPWFCEELERAGIRYDSSEFPIKTPLFGDGNSPTRPYLSGKLLRIPVTVIELGGARIPFSSGAFFRLAPLWMIRFGFKHALRAGKPAMAVLHPRELDPGHPRLPLTGWESRVHYARLETTVPKLEAILKSMKWTSIAEQLQTLQNA
jgi:polysaccharide deacetylase family protein (PEP-CTERM system associated)